MPVIIAKMILPDVGYPQRGEKLHRHAPLCFLNFKRKKMNEKVTAESFTLRTESGQWLGQVVLTSDGLFSSVTDYGNFAYAWRSYGEKDFKDFILQLDIPYFAGKMYQGISYVAYGKKFEKAAERFAEMILPALQAEIKKQRIG
jgi:hypothetical protein